MPAQLKGLSPVAIAMPSPNKRFGLTQSVDHDWATYAPQPKQYAVNHLQCWYACKQSSQAISFCSVTSESILSHNAGCMIDTNVPDYDVTAIVHGVNTRAI